MKKIVNIPGTILKELRVSLNIPLNVAAVKLKVETETLKQWEENGVTVSVAKARKISKFYNRHWTILLLNKIPSKKDLSKEYRNLMATGGEYSTETLLALRNAERILFLADSIEGRITNRNEIKSFNADFSSNINDLTEKVREWLDATLIELKKYKYDYEVLAAWISKVESKGIYVSQIKMPGDEVSAFTLSDSRRSVIVLNKSDSTKRKLFSLLHEFAHILLDKGTTFDIYEGRYYENKVEVFCNKLAGNLLVPEAVVRKFWNLTPNLEEMVDIVSKRYKVSSQVVLRRVYDLGLIEKPLFEKLNTELEKSYKDYIKIKKTKEFIPSKNFYQKSVIKKNSQAFSEDVFEAYRLNRITYNEIAKYMGVKLNHVAPIEHLLLYA